MVNTGLEKNNIQSEKQDNNKTGMYENEISLEEETTTGVHTLNSYTGNGHIETEVGEGVVLIDHSSISGKSFNDTPISVMSSGHVGLQEDDSSLENNNLSLEESVQTLTHPVDDAEGREYSMEENVVTQVYSQLSREAEQQQQQQQQQQGQGQEQPLDLQGEEEIDYMQGMEGDEEIIVNDEEDVFKNVAQGLDGKYRELLINFWQDLINQIESLNEKGGEEVSTGGARDNDGLEQEQDQNQNQDQEPYDPFKTHNLPLARIKKVMKIDENVKMISAETPILFAQACEIFITELTLRAWAIADENKRRTLQKQDVADALQKSDMYDFLIDIVSRQLQK